MEVVESLEESNCFETELTASTKPVVTLKDGFGVKELNDGVDFEIKENYLEYDDEERQPFFDTEEVFQQLNYECIGNADYDSDSNENEGPFAVLKRKMTALGDDGGVFKMVVKNGVGQLVSPGAICRVHYNGYIEYQDEPFDSTRLRNSQTQMRHGECFIRGFDVALATMRKGEISKYIFSPSYAYQVMGCPPRIPPNAHVMFEIELVSFVDQSASDEFAEFSKEEQDKASFENILKVAESFKETGNDLFRQSNFFLAIKKYNKGIQLLETCHLKDDVEEKAMTSALLLLYLNASLCAIKLGQGIRAKKFGRKALELDSKNIKAMYRIALGHQKEGEFAKARDWYLRAQRLEPNNPDLRKALQQLDQDVQRWKVSEKQMCERMFSHQKSSSTDNSTSNEQREETPANFISDEIKSVMSQRLQDFQKDENQNEIIFPTSLTTKEIDFLVKKATEMNLNPIPPANKIPYLKIKKEK